MRSQIVTSNGRGGRRYLPYVFTEQGIAMLSAVLNSNIAIQVSIQIMTAFVEMRKFLVNNAVLLERISNVELKQLEYQKKTDDRFEQVFDYIAEYEEVKQKIFFEGQIYDAFSLLVNMVGSAEKSIILIDNYVDVDTLNILSKKKTNVNACIYTKRQTKLTAADVENFNRQYPKLEVKYTSAFHDRFLIVDDDSVYHTNVNACIYTKRQTKLTAADVENFNRQYPKLEVKYTSAFHDRFLIVDDDSVYHIGASLKDAGKKCFAINLLEDRRIVKDILHTAKYDA